MSLGSHCNPGCNIFDPTKSCKHSDLSLDYQTFTQAFWSYRSQALRRNSHWHLFYDCFHPKPKDKDQITKFAAVFPDDVPLLGNQMAMSNYDTGKHLDEDDPGFWSKDRLNAAISGSGLERRMATTDWDWDWFSSLKKKGIAANMAMCKNKNQLDKILFKEFGEKYENTGIYSLKKTHKEFIRLSTLYNSLEEHLLLKIDFID